MRNRSTSVAQEKGSDTVFFSSESQAKTLFSLRVLHFGGFNRSSAGQIPKLFISLTLRSNRSEYSLAISVALIMS